MAPNTRTNTCTSGVRHLALLIALVLLATTAITCRADTVASLLGNFTINQYCGLRLGNARADVHYVVVFGQLPALRELHLADANGDGVTSQEERDAYVRLLAPGLADQLKLTVDGAAVPLHAVRWATSLPTEQGGFSLRLDVDFSGALPPIADESIHSLEFSNQNYPGRFGWQEIVVDSAPSLALFDSNAYGTSVTAGLTEALKAMPASGPLGERSVHLKLVRGLAPPGAQLLQPRTDAMTSAAQATAKSDDTAAGWIERNTHGLIQLISTPHIPLHVAVFALLAAALLGALHAFAPGHGKTVVGAYLIGSRGTPRHAVFLGVTVTVTHTLGVFALGFATLFASRYIIPERLFPVLSFISGLLVVGMGIVLLAQRWRGARKAASGLSHRQSWQLGLTGVVRKANLPRPASRSGATRNYRPVSAHHDSGLTHSHGGSVHSHLPPLASDESLSWRSLLALGISGGLVPCPSAMVLLLAAVALNKTAYGLLLVVAFSVGLAATLTAVGLAFLYARSRIRTPRADARWPLWLPVASAAAITLIGAVMCYGAVATWVF